ncbi:MCP four helix bundle domain-containing protein [Pontibacter sp. E15-1]|uniref:MCP four helix bundle domain-containing protein n=1 Tax=Pontibacter sp. E15-1 TaxID=2919918 RepID=UPI001F4FDC36|nr:MCP four helix bundle domain-containing protein [Pontibacter sp. E15-1]MCJ8163633.1 MCP four helix bundle domain-containing protein [Pontibacter sp. E15-1]
MNKTISNRQRYKIALALCAIFVIIVLANWWVSYSMTRVSRQFASVYHDRLVPALDLAAMQEHYYQGMTLLERHLQAPDPGQQRQLEAQLRQHHTDIDSIAAKYEATYLTPRETTVLQQYKAAANRLMEVQLKTVRLSSAAETSAAVKLREQKVDPAFMAVLNPLHALRQLQQEVGHDLYASAGQQLNTLKMLSYLVIALAVVLALLVGVLLQNNRRGILIKPQKFNLN